MPGEHLIFAVKSELCYFLHLKGEARVRVISGQTVLAGAGILGVLLAGKCLAPLLPQENDDYLRYSRKNSGASVIVCSGELEKRGGAVRFVSV